MAPFISCVTRGGRLFYGSELQVKTVRGSNFVPEYRKYEINDAMGGTVGFIIPNMDPDGDEWFGNPVDLIEVAQGYALDDPAAPDYGRKRLWQPDNEIDTTAEGPGNERTVKTNCTVYITSCGYHGKARLHTEKGLELSRKVSGINRN
jgi:hypothetical protein